MPLDSQAGKRFPCPIILMEVELTPALMGLAGELLLEVISWFYCRERAPKPSLEVRRAQGRAGPAWEGSSRNSARPWGG